MTYEEHLLTRCKFSGKPHYRFTGRKPLFQRRTDEPRLCLDCQRDISQMHYVSIRCPYCSKGRAKQSVHEATKGKPKQNAAHRIVFIAVNSGILPRLDGSINCVDCGKFAEHYEHRDYLKPLDVEPVCLSCNFRRGPAANAA